MLLFFFRPQQLFIALRYLGRFIACTAVWDAAFISFDRASSIHRPPRRPPICIPHLTHITTISKYLIFLIACEPAILPATPPPNTTKCSGFVIDQRGRPSESTDPSRTAPPSIIPHSTAARPTKVNHPHSLNTRECSHTTCRRAIDSHQAQLSSHEASTTCLGVCVCVPAYQLYYYSLLYRLVYI